jgi:ATP-binding protein involved in chromosome partitioning
MKAGRVIAVASGKGGVGKSSIALGLASALLHKGQRVGLLDADLYGPDIPLMLGITRKAPAKQVTLWQAAGQPGALVEPITVNGLSIMSLQFLIAEQQAFAVAGPLANMMVGRLCRQVEWGPLDYLIVDLPPGTGDITQAIVESAEVDGVLIVVTPAPTSHLDTMKLLSFLAQRDIEVIGGVENTAMTRCPHCNTDIELYQPDDRYSVWSKELACLARLAHYPHRASAGRHSLSDYLAAELGPVAGHLMSPHQHRIA